MTEKKTRRRDSRPFIAVDFAGNAGGANGPADGGAPPHTISVVTPTLDRPAEVRGLLLDFCRQTYPPLEVILVDGAPAWDRETESVVAALAPTLPFACHYVRDNGGTAIQRNVGIDLAQGSLVVFIDDDVRLDPAFFRTMVDAFVQDAAGHIGGIVGRRVNQHFRPEDRVRWRWYRRLQLLRTFEPGRYDFACGYPVNANMQEPFSGLRPVDFMTTSCAVWRREVFLSGLRFDPFFSDYGVLEDAHLSLRAGSQWQLRVCGDAWCEHLQSPRGRVSRRRLGLKCVVNYYYVFSDIAGPLRAGQKFRFWRFQCFELLRMTASALRRRRMADLAEVVGRLEGILAVARGAARTGSGRAEWLEGHARDAGQRELARRADGAAADSDPDAVASRQAAS